MKKNTKLIIWIVVLAALLLAAYIFYEKYKNQSFGDPQEKIMAPDFTLEDLDGNSVTLSDYEGKIVILNFWAEWCIYCVEEMPDFNTLDKELAESGDAIILAVNVRDSQKTVQDFLAENSLGLKVLMDEDGTVASMYSVSGYPTTFFINPDGSLYTYIPGKTDLKTLHVVLDMIRNGKPLR